MARQIVKVQGLRELEAALGELGKAVGKRVCRKALTFAGEPIARAARGLAPVLTGDLQESYDVGTKLSRRQAALHKKESTVEVFVGAGPNPQSITQEFGTFDQPAQPSLRPAWDAQKMYALEITVGSLDDEIQKAAARASRKSARLGR